MITMSTNPKILIVDDEAPIVNLASSYFKAEGYQVITAYDGAAGLKAALTQNPDVVILDIMLPELDGLEVLTRIRDESQVYVILLTARTDEMDRVLGLSVGADDYVTKPFSPRELTARVKAALRRIQGVRPEVLPTVLSFRHMRLDTGARQVYVDGTRVDLTAIEFDMLTALAENRNRVLTRTQLLEKVWGYGYFEDTRVIDVHLGHLRQKLGPQVPIATVRGVGYRFEDEPL